MSYSMLRSSHYETDAKLRNTFSAADTRIIYNACGGVNTLQTASQLCKVLCITQGMLMLPRGSTSYKWRIYFVLFAGTDFFKCAQQSARIPLPHFEKYLRVGQKPVDRSRETCIMPLVTQ